MEYICNKTQIYAAKLHIILQINKLVYKEILISVHELSSPKVSCRGAEAASDAGHGLHLAQGDILLELAV